MSDLVATRLALQRVATHVLARRRHQLTGRFGLRATPGGVGTPAFGPPETLEVVRTSGTDLVHERGGDESVVAIPGTTLRALADHVGVDLSQPFDVGRDTAPVGDVDAPIELDEDAARALADWYALGWRIFDAVATFASHPSPAQLWPEHFDASILVSIGPGEDDRCDVGVSPGDGFSHEPYLYVGPWTKERPGGPGYWNADFGAMWRRSEIASATDAVDRVREGLQRFGTSA